MTLGKRTLETAGGTNGDIGDRHYDHQYLLLHPPSPLECKENTTSLQQ